MLKKSYFLLIIITLICSACGSKPSKPDNINVPKTPTPTSSPTPGTKSSGTSTIESVYSDISGKTCKQLEFNEEGAYSKMGCDGIGGYNFIVEDFDARMDVTIVDASGKEHALKLIEKIGPGFSALGDKAEWRVIKDNGKIIPLALIIRYNTNEVPDDPSKNTSYLTVTKITEKEICVVDKISPSPKANEDARKSADIANTKACLN